MRTKINPLAALLPGFVVKPSKISFTFCLTALLLLCAETSLRACGGTPPPPCGRSVFLAKFAPAVVVVPAAGPIVVPIGVLPFATWNTSLLCAQPVSATLDLTLMCAPSGAVIGPQFFAVATPTVPGAQPVAGPLPFVIPAGTFPPGSPPQICLVSGTYSVTFSDGVTLAFTGDTEICLVPSSPLAPTVPRLEMRYIPLAPGEFYRTCRRGDQANFYFLIANNDPNHEVTLDLTSTGRQVAHLPNGFTPQNAYANDVFAISDPIPGTDTYPAAFVDDLQPGQLLDEPNPFIPNEQLLTRSLTLLPGEAIIVGIAMRSYGMCANGSCNERLVKVMGAFANGDPALGCVSTLLLVDDQAPKSPLCEYADTVKTGPQSIATWSPALFSNPSGTVPNALTFYAGNLPLDGANIPGFLTAGIELSSPFPPMAADYVRMNGMPTNVSYSVRFTSSNCQSGGNNVTVTGLPDAVRNVFPVISWFELPPNEALDIHFNAAQDFLQITFQGFPLFQGPAGAFFIATPPEFCIDFDICRIIDKASPPDEKAIYVQPPALSRLFCLNSTPGCDDTLGVYNQMGVPADWTGTVSGAGVSLFANSGVGTLVACYDTSGLPEIPATTLSFLDISCVGALNNPVRVPVAIRRFDYKNCVIGTAEPSLVELSTGYPNPFSAMTTIAYTLRESARVSLTIYNQFGQEVCVLVQEARCPAGSYTAEWDGNTQSGKSAAAGLYYGQIAAGSDRKTVKIMLIR